MKNGSRKFVAVFVSISQNLELTRAINDVSGEMVTLLNLGTTCELLNCLDKAIEWHTLVTTHCHVTVT